jgi:small subunit ribosomal protein S13
MPEQSLPQKPTVLQATPQAAKPQAPAKSAVPVNVKPAAPKPVLPQKPTGPELKHLVRIANTDLDGKKTISFALAKIKGVGIPFAHAACRLAGVELTKKAGHLSDAEVKRVEDVIKDPLKAGMAPWLLNRRNDTDTGKNLHVVTADLQFAVENDIRMMKKMRSYKGVRHMLGQPVRGQRTRSHFRKNKGKVLGVRRSATAKPAAAGKT